MTATLRVGPAPIAVAVDTTTNTIFVLNTNGGHGSISKVDGATHATTTTEALGMQPLGFTLDAANNTLYVLVGASVSIMDEKTLFTSGANRLTFDQTRPVASVLDGGAHTLCFVTSLNGATGQLLVAPDPDNSLGALPSVPVGISPKAVALDPQSTICTSSTATTPSR